MKLNLLLIDKLIFCMQNRKNIAIFVQRIFLSAVGKLELHQNNVREGQWLPDRIAVDCFNSIYQEYTHQSES